MPGGVYVLTSFEDGLDFFLHDESHWGGLSKPNGTRSALAGGGGGGGAVVGRRGGGGQHRLVKWRRSGDADC